ncbi:MAG: tRNA (adenosine(37)-N6)-threonylcarbamoyltransferase complex ATPase subunit type 1 TsaE [Clostridia bacterium]|nr:tRNA (adenosine(37)-N6)-threonylcarbamoyltransferase complex ATPase subunit type 1 TsaE [Clostridia bacterium]
MKPTRSCDGRRALVIQTHSAEETRELGKRLAKLLRAGDVVLLQGDLGAGKSELARGVARGLGVSGPVPSPSFTILNAYDEGSVPLYHFDWYRIHDPDEIAQMGMDEQLGGDGIALIEWSSRAEEYVPERNLTILIRATGEETREITFLPMGGFPFGEEMLA